MSRTIAYLDQNHWIYLAKDYWGKPHKPAHRGLAERLLASAMSDRVRLPLSVIHFIEHLRAESGPRRRRLAEVFDLFNCCWHMASWSNVLPTEVHHAIAETFSVEPLIPKPELFGKGFLFGLGPKERAVLLEGRTEEQLNRLESIVTLPGAVLDLLTFPNELRRGRLNARITESGSANAAAAEVMRSQRKSYPTTVHRKAQYAEYTHHHLELIAVAMQELGLPKGDFFTLSLQQLCTFWSRVPSLDVDCELTIYRDRQWSRSVDANDVRDIGHLALAVPYCDVVVTERFWARALSETGLAEKYRTAICTDLTELMKTIEVE